MDASGFVDKPKELERKKQAAMAKFNLGAYEDEDEEEGEEGNSLSRPPSSLSFSGITLIGSSARFQKHI